MKKIITLFTILFIGGMFLQTTHAQVTGHAPIKVGGSAINALSGKGSSHDQSMSVIDTLAPPIFNDTCSDTFYYYTYTNSTGYVTGNNKVNNGLYRSVEVAQRYNFSGTGSISDVLIRYGKKTGTNGITSARIYNVSAVTKKPTTLLDSSQNTITTGNIVDITPWPYADYFFSPPVNVTTNFALSCVFPKPANGDTVVVWQTNFNCHSTDSLASEHYKDSSYVTDAGWYLYTYLLNAKQTNPNDTSLDLWILPIIDVTNGINDPPTSQGLSLLGAYPNPAKTMTTISYRVDKSAEASVSVFDLSGKVYQNYTQHVISGDHQFKLNVSDMAAGNYFYTIKTEDAMMTSKFTVVK